MEVIPVVSIHIIPPGEDGVEFNQEKVWKEGQISQRSSIQRPHSGGEGETLIDDAAGNSSAGEEQETGLVNSGSGVLLIGSGGSGSGNEVDPEVDDDDLVIVDEEDIVSSELQKQHQNQLSLPQQHYVIMKRMTSGEFSTVSFNHAGSVVAMHDRRLSMDLSSFTLRDEQEEDEGGDLNPNRWYSKFGLDGSSPDALEIITVNDRQVISQGTIEALVGVFFGVQSLSIDPLYLHDFLSTFRFFLTPLELLEFLIRQFATMEIIRQHDKSKEENMLHGQRRLLNFLRKWFERFTQDFIRTPQMELKLRDFLTSNLCQAERHRKFIEGFYAKIDDNLGNLSHDAEIESNDLGGKSPAASSPPADFSMPTAELLSLHNKAVAEETLAKLSEDQDFINIRLLWSHFTGHYSAGSIAQQITYMEFDMFTKIEELEFMDHLQVPQDYPTPNLNQMIGWTERMIDWISEEICLVKDLKERAETIGYFISMAKHCLELWNFNAVFEIVSGLSLSPVQRLTKTWKAVLAQSKYKTLWRELLRFVSPAANYYHYCQMVDQGLLQGKPVLPWLKIFLSDLELISRSVTYASENRINFYKFHLIARILRTLEHCKKLIFDISAANSLVPASTPLTSSPSATGMIPLPSKKDPKIHKWFREELVLKHNDSVQGACNPLKNNLPNMNMNNLNNGSSATLQRFNMAGASEKDLLQNKMEAKVDHLYQLSLQCEPLPQSELKKTNDVFGVDLAVIISRLGVPTKWTHGRIPRFVRDIFDILEKEESLKSVGLFRTSGNQTKILELRDQLIDSRGESLSLEESTCHDIAGLLKMYLRELPDPLISSKLYHSYVAVSKLSDPQQQMEVLKSLSLMLPDSNRNLMTYFLKYLYLLSTYHEKNKMDTYNIAVCLAPTFFGKRGQSPNKRTSTPLFQKSNEAQISETLKKQGQLSMVLQLIIESQATNSNFMETERKMPPVDALKKSKKKFSFSNRDGKF